MAFDIASKRVAKGGGGVKGGIGNWKPGRFWLGKCLSTGPE